MHAWRRLVDSKEFGRILRTETVMASTPGIPQNDERWKFDLAGMDSATNAINYLQMNQC